MKTKFNPVSRDISEFENEKWRIVKDYESDDIQVDLLDVDQNIVESFFYPKFTWIEFEMYKLRACLTPFETELFGHGWSQLTISKTPI